MSTEDEVYRRIYDDPRFKTLVNKRGRFAWTLAIIMLLAYYGFIILIAFDPQLLGMKVAPDTVITWGIPAGLGLIFLSFLLTGIYVVRANGEFDRLNRELLKEHGQ
ncbi:hypothetical protein ABI_21670 [Asticcacaulis biprosthecium C19]|uniref:Inner membrane protein yjcH n=1 Tax=Asticcacaulis biprosthecium C19 TaxID=715226 RepID=F4QGX2_9CAUL|nr:DUF485 domain-containing protein [Asticcacaulis biprosthecium]EGF93725.1 hypothetical protein ABI_21670 [Asticcacaulis biprosthecium C19]